MSAFGFRWWNLGRDGSLRSAAFSDEVWPPNEELHAECRAASKAHSSLTVPELSCGCGYWGFWNAEDAAVLPHIGYFQQAKAFGVIEAWGGIVEHEFGFRAEYVVLRAITVLRGHLHAAYSDVARYRQIDKMLQTWDVGDLKQVM